jgi:lipopolysaccharide export system protein LptA
LRATRRAPWLAGGLLLVSPLADALAQGAPPAGEPPPAPVAAAGPQQRSTPFGLALDSEGPISIEAQELEAEQRDGQRRLVFTGDVRVAQADVRLRSDRLEAYYSGDSNQPDRLVATSGVRFTQGDQMASCDEATYDRLRAILVCRGHAEMRDGDDRVKGEVIEFDLEAEVVRIRGGASLVIHPEPPGEGPEPGAGDGPPAEDAS